MLQLRNPGARDATGRNYPCEVQTSFVPEDGVQASFSQVLPPFHQPAIYMIEYAGQGFWHGSPGA